MQPATDGFNLSPWTLLDAADEMHVDHGMVHHITKEIKHALNPTKTTISASMQAVDSALKASPPRAEVSLPSAGLSGAFAMDTCSKTIALAKLLPVALLAAIDKAPLLEEVLDSYILILQGIYLPVSQPKKLSKQLDVWSNEPCA